MWHNLFIPLRVDEYVIIKLFSNIIYDPNWYYFQESEVNHSVTNRPKLSLNSSKNKSMEYQKLL